MPLQSQILSGNARLESAANGAPSIKPAPPPDDVDAVKRIQRGLQKLGHSLPKSFSSGPTGEPDGKYGQETYQEVIKFQQEVFPGQPGEWDGRVGKKTLAKMDALLPKKGAAPAPTPVPPKTHASMISDAADASRSELRRVLARLQSFQGELDRFEKADGTDKIVAFQSLARNFARDSAVITDKLRTSADPTSKEFRSALDQAVSLIQQNLTQRSNIEDGGSTGRCDPKQFNPPGVPFGATRRTDADPRVSACDPFFPQNPAMQRDVITHEFFHLVGLADMNAINNTKDALNDANTMAQVAAYIHDRTRTQDSSGLSKPSVTYPSP